MNMELFKNLIKVRPLSLLLTAVLVVVNAGMFTYHEMFQKPELTNLRIKALDLQRDGSGKIPHDAAEIFRQGNIDLLEYNKRIPEKKEFARLLGDLFDMAKNNSLTIGSISYRPATIKEESLLTYSISCNVAGKYVQIKSFISDLIKFRDIIVIDKISLNNSRMTEEYVDMKIELTSYFRMVGR